MIETAAGSWEDESSAVDVVAELNDGPWELAPIVGRNYSLAVPVDLRT